MPKIELNDPVIGGRTASTEPPPYRFMAVLRHPLPREPRFAVLIPLGSYVRKVRSRSIQIGDEPKPAATVFVRNQAELRCAMRAGWNRNVTDLWEAAHGPPDEDGLYLWEGAAHLHEPDPEPTGPTPEEQALQSMSDEIAKIVHATADRLKIPRSGPDGTLSAPDRLGLLQERHGPAPRPETTRVHPATKTAVPVPSTPEEVEAVREAGLERAVEATKNVAAVVERAGGLEAAVAIQDAAREADVDEPAPDPRDELTAEQVPDLSYRHLQRALKARDLSAAGDADTLRARLLQAIE